jgi:hypothetical protein
MASQVRQALWVACGLLVFLGIFFAAVGAFHLTIASGAALVLLAGLWLTHEWTGLWRDEHHPG